jgi:hypothetical protein
LGGTDILIDYERPVSVGNKVFLGGTVKKVASSGITRLDVSPFMRNIEHVMYIAPVTNFRPINLSLATDDDARKHDIVIDCMQITWNNRTDSPAYVNLAGTGNNGETDGNFELLTNGDEIAKFLIIGTK